MPLEAVENYNKTESQNKFGPEQKYHDLERGDVDPFALAQNAAQNQLSQQQQQQQSSFDPVVFIKNMISAGFTPSQAQISTASNHLSGSNDSSNTWFAIFLQKLMRQARQKK